MAEILTGSNVNTNTFIPLIRLYILLNLSEIFVLIVSRITTQKKVKIRYKKKTI